MKCLPGSVGDITSGDLVGSLMLARNELFYNVAPVDFTNCMAMYPV